MAYNYIMQAYGFDAIVGRRVKHETAGEGVIAKEDGNQAHYVQVKFDNRKHPAPCHPLELTYI